MQLQSPAGMWISRKLNSLEMWNKRSNRFISTHLLPLTSCIPKLLVHYISRTSNVIKLSFLIFPHDYHYLVDSNCNCFYWRRTLKFLGTWKKEILIECFSSKGFDTWVIRIAEVFCKHALCTWNRDKNL